MKIHTKSMGVTNMSVPNTKATAPGLKGNLLMGNLLDMQKQGMIEFYVKNWKKFGDIALFEMGPMASF